MTDAQQEAKDIAATLRESGVTVLLMRESGAVYDVVSPARSVIGTMQEAGSAEAVFLPASKSRLGRFQLGGLSDAMLKSPLRFALMSGDVRLGDTISINGQVRGSVIAVTPVSLDTETNLLLNVLINSSSQAVFQGLDSDTVFIDGSESQMLTTEDGETLTLDD